jgi:hypothetical protein
MNRIVHENLATAVAAAAKFCPGARCQKPILRTVRVSREDDTTTVTATDLNVQITIAIQGGVGSGVSLVPAEAAKAGVRCVEYDDKVVVAGGVTSPAQDPMEYPCCQLLQSPATASLWFDVVEWIADAVSPATDEYFSSQFAMGGIHLETAGGSVVAVATDGRRLHAIDSPSVSGPFGALDLISPPGVFTGLVQAVRAVARDVLGVKGRRLESILETSAAVQIRQSESDVELRWSLDGITVAVSGRKVRGRFPPWRDFLVSGNSLGIISLPVKEGMEQLKAASRFQTDRSKGVLFRDGKITAGDEDTGVFEAPMAGMMDSPAVKLNPAFVIDAIKAVGGVGGIEADFRVYGNLVRLDSLSGVNDYARLRIAISPLSIDSES